MQSSATSASDRMRSSSGSRPAAQGVPTPTPALGPAPPRAARLAHSTDAVVGDSSIRSNALIERLEAGSAGLSDTIVVHGDSLVARLNDAADRLHDTVVVRGQVLEDRMTGSSERLTSLIRDRAEEAAAVLDAASARWGG